MPNIDWTSYREEITTLYTQGWSGRMIAKKIGFKCAAVRGFLSREGIIRSMSEARKLALKNGRAQTPLTFNRIGDHTYYPPKEKRICESCSSEYQPNGAKQRWCFICAPDNTFRAKLMRYGVSKPIWDRMLANQNGVCALCSREPTVVDHDHKTGRVRGLLCGGCNSALNRVELEGWVEAAKKYIAEE